MADEIVFVPVKEDSLATLKIRLKPNSSGSIYEDTIQNTSCTISGFNAMSDIDPVVFNNSYSNGQSNCRRTY